VYNVLPFGLTTSASVFCAFTAVTAKAVRDSGLVSALIMYVDDFGGSVGQERDNSFEDQPMHKHKRKADYVMHCDASDHALTAIIIKAPDEKCVQRPFYRRLHPYEVGWSSVLRELTG
jgi:hypothetical protein